MVSPRCQGPAIIKDILLNSPNQGWAAGQGVKIYVSDNNSDGVVSTGTFPNVSGQLIFEELQSKYASLPPTTAPVLAPIKCLYTVTGEQGTGTVIPLEYPVNKTSFFVKVLMVGQTSQMEGMLRVLEGVDLTRFF
jgi:hypothetical protein